jgi:energy-coupling factor transport system permease protein
MDADRLQAQVARVAPRSALTCALAARLIPTLQRDAHAIAETARLRGVALADGRWTGRARHAAPLVLPLLGSSLARGLDVAEAMTARGYGAGPRTRVSEAGYDAVERAVLAIAIALCAVAAGALALGAVAYAYYPRLEGPLTLGPAAVAAATLALLLGASVALRR